MTTQKKPSKPSKKPAKAKLQGKAPRKTTVRKKKIQDPFAEREATNYAHPIPSREFILEYLRNRGQPTRRADIIKELGLTSDEEQEALRRRLRAMERDGQLVFNRRGGYGLIEKMNLIRGRVLGHKEGYGFLIPDEGGDDLFLNAQQMRTVFSGDRVLVRVKHVDRRGRREGEIVEVLERNTSELVGRYFMENGLGFVVPDNSRICQDIIIPSDQQNNAKNGQYVMVSITAPPTIRSQAVGRVIEVLGDHMAPGLEIDVAIRAHSLPYVWPDAVQNEITNFTGIVSENDKKNRVELRDKAFVTIDGEDAKDFDDAVYCRRIHEKLNHGWKLYVAIADVANYVKPGSILDFEAKNRGNSVYFPNKVLPMLPESLSNGLCSLKPNLDRLVVVCEMNIDAHGILMDYAFYEGIIHSQARLTYTQVANMLNNSEQNPKNLLPHIKEFHGLFKKLLRQRQLRGAIDFNTVETKIVFGEKGKIARIVPVHRNEAHRMIEEAMLLANVSAADYLIKSELPTLYRVHEGPESQRLLALHDFLKPFNLKLSGGKKPKPKDYAKLIARIDDRPDSHLLQTVLLRSLKQALYSPENSGHFGLAYDAYTHFTSPIRRYPDLLVHRGIKYLLAKKHKHSTPEFPYSVKSMHEVGQHCSMTERRADLTTRDATDWLKCEYMLNKQGQVFQGIISDVTSFGVFVELNDIYIQGLLHITALKNDYYRYDPTNHLLQGRHSGQIYRLGDPIEVLVSRVDLDKRLIDFDLTTSDFSSSKREKKRRKKR